MTKKVSDLSDGGYARELSSLVFTRSNYESMLQSMMGTLLQAVGAPAVIQKEISAIVLEAMPYDKILELNTEVYGKRFKDSELQELVAFHKTPVGAKLVSEHPSVTQDLGQLMNALATERVPPLIQKYLENMDAAEAAARKISP